MAKKVKSKIKAKKIVKKVKKIKNPASVKSSGEAKEAETDVTKLAVEDLKLTGRTLNALLNNGVKTVGGILKKSEKSLSELEGMGDKAISEIKRKLKKLGLELKQGE